MAEMARKKGLADHFRAGLHEAPDVGDLGAFVALRLGHTECVGIGNETDALEGFRAAALSMKESSLTLGSDMKSFRGPGRNAIFFFNTSQKTFAQDPPGHDLVLNFCNEASISQTHGFRIK